MIIANNINSNQLFESIQKLWSEAKGQVVQSINHILVLTYFEIEKLIVKNEQNGKKRAEYGKQSLNLLSIKLLTKFGKGYPVCNLERMRRFYLAYKDRITLNTTINEKSATLLQKSKDPFKLSWSHYLLLIKIDNLNLWAWSNRKQMDL